MHWQTRCLSGCRHWIIHRLFYKCKLHLKSVLCLNLLWCVDLNGGVSCMIAVEFEYTCCISMMMIIGIACILFGLVDETYSSDTSSKGWKNVFSRINQHPPGRNPGEKYIPYAYNDDVITWKYSPSYWPFVRETHRSPVNCPKGQWRGALIFSLICIWLNGWVNNREAGGLRRHRPHYDVIIMWIYKYSMIWCLNGFTPLPGGYDVSGLCGDREIFYHIL